MRGTKRQLNYWIGSWVSSNLRERKREWERETHPLLPFPHLHTTQHNTKALSLISRDRISNTLTSQSACPSNMIIIVFFLGPVSGAKTLFLFSTAYWFLFSFLFLIDNLLGYAFVWYLQPSYGNFFIFFIVTDHLNLIVWGILLMGFLGTLIWEPRFKL